VSRHGSRGLSSPSNDLALYNLWLDAEAKGSLTKAGRLLGPDLLRIIQANALLGYGVPGITTPGYGNLTLVGIVEHTGLGQRLASRTSKLLTNAETSHRFTHAEIMIPFQEKLGLPSASVSVPGAQTYTWQTNPWRGESMVLSLKTFNGIFLATAAFCS
jgi:hypothetical protein